MGRHPGQQFLYQIIKSAVI